MVVPRPGRGLQGHAIHTIERRRKRRFVRLLAALAVLAVASLIAVCAWFSFSINVPVGGSEQQVITIADGSSISQIADQLAEAGMIRSAWAFATYTRFGPAHGQLKPGPYQLKSSMSTVQIIDYLASGKIAVKTFVARDGSTMKQLAASYEAQGLGSATEFSAALQTTTLPTQLAAAFPEAKQDLEGFLLGDSYQVVANEPAASVVQKMLNNFAAKALPLFKATPSPQKLTNYQTLTLASIVEKEASRDADRAGVAGVFYNRLRAGIKLESDVTVIYLTGRIEPTAADLAIDSPYNTRKYAGLPPTPINSPSLSSIEHTLKPIASDYIFFIGGSDGKVYYAVTYAEHQDNIRKYIK